MRITLLHCNTMLCSKRTLNTTAKLLEQKIIQQASNNGRQVTWTSYQIRNSDLKLIKEFPTNTQAKFKFIPHVAISNRFQLMFLPKDYPQSVNKEYITYSIYSFAQSVTGTVTGTMATQAMLQALGASASISIVLSATTNWIIKDGVGLLGGVLYASIVSNKFDSHPKRFRFLSNLLIQFSTLLELLTPMFPALFLPLASISNIGKNVGWLASSATRAAMHNGFTRKENLGDITAKSGAQGTAAGLIGTGAGVALSLVIGTAPVDLLFAFVPISAVNLACGYMASACVVTRTLNRDRAELMFVNFTRNIVNFSIKNADNPTMHPNSLDQVTVQPLLQTLSTPEQVSLQEKFVQRHVSPFSVKLKVDEPLDTLLSSSSASSGLVEALVDPLFENEQYRLFVDEQNRVVYLWYLEHVTSKSLLKGMYHACLVRAFIEVTPNSSTEILGHTARVINNTFNSVIQELKFNGWQLEFPFIQRNNQRNLRIYSKKN